ILLPQSLYSIQNRDFLLAQTGAEAYGRVRMGALGALEYRFYGGTIYLAVNDQSTVSTPITNLDVPYVAGERLIWETPLEGLRVGGRLQALRFDAATVLPNIGPVSLGIPAVLWVGSAESALHDLLLAAEYSRWIARLDTNRPDIIPPIRGISERAYGMAS